MGHIISIVYKPAGIDSRPADCFARVAIEHAELVENAGIANDLKAGIKDRHLNVMAREVLDQLQQEGCRTQPGEMGEQIVLSGIALHELPNGTRLMLGSSAVIEIVNPRTGCSRFEHIQQKTPKDVKGRLGAMCRVIHGGPIRVGDVVEPVSST